MDYCPDFLEMYDAALGLARLKHPEADGTELELRANMLLQDQFGMRLNELHERIMTSVDDVNLLGRVAASDHAKLAKGIASSGRSRSAGALDEILQQLSCRSCSEAGRKRTPTMTINSN